MDCNKNEKEYLHNILARNQQLTTNSIGTVIYVSHIII